MAPVPEDNAALREPGPDASDSSGAAGSLRLPLSPAGADRVRWVSIAATLVAAVALLVAQGTGYAATLAVTLVLALAVAWGWPLLSGSYTPMATTVALAV